MKKLLSALASAALFLSLGVLVCCSGSDEPSQGETGPVMLVSNKAEILANGIDQAAFTVTRGTSDLTKTAEIWKTNTDGTQEKVEKPVFTSKTTGTYKFEARYTTTDGEALVSDPVTVKAVETPKEVFYRRIFLQQFTSVNCPSCPNLTSTLEVLAKKDEWKDRFIHTTFHADFNGIDPMSVPATELYMRQLRISGYPACVLDLIYDTRVMFEMDAIIKQMNRVLTDYPATCGIAIDSKYDSNSRQVTVTAKVKASWTNEYRIIGFLLEDGIQARQNNDTGYIHDNTVRVVFASSLNGEKLGIINADSEATHTFTATLAEGWKADKMRVAICVLNKVNDDFFGNNSAMCPLDGSIEYKLND